MDTDRVKEKLRDDALNAWNAYCESATEAVVAQNKKDNAWEEYKVAADKLEEYLRNTA